VTSQVRPKGGRKWLPTTILRDIPGALLAVDIQPYVRDYFRIRVRELRASLRAGVERERRRKERKR